ncbi:rho GTPase-activating protein 6-like isoform A [Alligator mississippiensis]|uniref:Rho GTPase-activating protein 6-like isoform A n=2 Tax=Alligator mississippiensis TaxID=8496 RepID=A0A151MQA8_ALLMI|nr:rho GTPase-activating protein 6-like isoform A [Alligator mississippiensis]
MQPVHLHSLSELERASLQRIAFYRLQENHTISAINFPKAGPKQNKSIRSKLESFSKEKKDCCPLAFGIPLSQVIANDRAHKQMQEAVKGNRRVWLEVEASVTEFRTQIQKKSPLGGSCVRSYEVLTDEPLSPIFLDRRSQSQRRGAVSVDSITDLGDNTSRLLEALQLSHPNELDLRRTLERKRMLSLNPIYRQVPRIVDRCCQHIEAYGLQTVGIFRVGSSKKRVQQLREEFDQGLDVFLDEHQSVHEVAALLKEFFRDMPDSLIPRKLYTAFVSTASVKGMAQLLTLQLLVYLLPPCNSDTLYRLLQFLNKVAQHAENVTGPDGQEILGNKMTASNLATIFGPNLLQREKLLERESSVMEIEDTTMVILVVQRLIENYEALFTVSTEVQQDILRNLFQTDPDVIDYLLRRKFKTTLLDTCKWWQWHLGTR